MSHQAKTRHAELLSALLGSVFLILFFKVFLAVRGRTWLGIIVALGSALLGQHYFRRWLAPRLRKIALTLLKISQIQ
jgi:hypothetical protein